MEKGVALEYNGISPRVVAKAQGVLLKKMLQIAEENSIEVYRDSDLVELLYTIDSGEQIPEELFGAVARVMAYCYEVNLDFKRKVHEVMDDG